MSLKRWRINISDSFSFGFLVVASVSMFLFEVFVVLPELENRPLVSTLHTVIGSFVFFSILSNLTMTMFIDTSTKRIILPALLKPLWHFCSACEANAPPRTYHCDKCNCCILKRDHHCTFAGCCIGHKNFRYFIAFLIYMTLGCFYATAFNMFFIWKYLGGFSIFAVCAHFVPLVFFVFGYLSLRVFLYTMLSMLALVSSFLVGHLLQFHVKQMLCNQTTFEKNNNIRIYDLGWRRNIREALGIRWCAALLWPFVYSPLPSDGFSFPTNENSKKIPENNVVAQNVRQRHS